MQLAYLRKEYEHIKDRTNSSLNTLKAKASRENSKEQEIEKLGKDLDFLTGSYNAKPSKKKPNED